jgi:hypothetical protein
MNGFKIGFMRREVLARVWMKPERYIFVCHSRLFVMGEMGNKFQLTKISESTSIRIFDKILPPSNLFSADWGGE